MAALWPPRPQPQPQLAEDRDDADKPDDVERVGAPQRRRSSRAPATQRPRRRARMMLTGPPRLQVRRPSPTTAEFTVSTRPRPTPARRLALALVHTARLLLLLAVVLLLQAKWALSPVAAAAAAPEAASSSPSSALSRLVVWPRARLARLAVGRLALRLAGPVPAWVLVPAAALALLYAVLRRIHTEERLLVLRGLGIQTSSTTGSVLLGAAATRFIPTDKIRDVLINEAFRGFEVRYYLVVVVEGEDEVVVVFPKTLPRRAIVEQVWRDVGRCLFDEDKGVHRGQKGGSVRDLTH